MTNLSKSASIKTRFPIPAAEKSDFLWVFSGRAAGNMSLSYGDTRDSLDNRRDFLEKLKIDYRNLVCAKQAHGSRIAYVDEAYIGKGAFDYEDSVADTDAFITDKKNVPLVIFTADCMPIFLYDPQRPAIGLVHAGWRGTKENIAVKTIDSMRRRFDTQVASLNISFGPAIRNCCYEVKEEFAGFFGPAVCRRDNRHYLDLAAANKRQLLAAGAEEENILDCGICTFCNNTAYFSFRREGNFCGRMMTVAMLK